MSADNVDSLTKPKKSKIQINTVEEEIPKVISAPKVDMPVVSAPKVDIPVVSEKPKKPRSQAQIDAFAKSAGKRKENIALRLKEKQIEKAKAILAIAEPPKVLEQPKPQLVPPTPVNSEVESTESEPEVVIEPKEKKVKKPVKKTKYRIVIDSSSDEDSSESEYEPPTKPVKQRSQDIPKPSNERAFSSQQNRKSKITVTHNDRGNMDGFFMD